MYLKYYQHNHNLEVELNEPADIKHDCNGTLPVSAWGSLSVFRQPPTSKSPLRSTGCSSLAVGVTVHDEEVRWTQLFCHIAALPVTLFLNSLARKRAFCHPDVCFTACRLKIDLCGSLYSCSYVFLLCKRWTWSCMCTCKFRCRLEQLYLLKQTSFFVLPSAPHSPPLAVTIYILVFDLLFFFSLYSLSLSLHFYCCNDAISRGGSLKFHLISSYINLFYSLYSVPHASLHYYWCLSGTLRSLDRQLFRNSAPPQWTAPHLSLGCGDGRRRRRSLLMKGSLQVVWFYRTWHVIIHFKQGTCNCPITVHHRRSANVVLCDRDYVVPRPSWVSPHPSEAARADVCVWHERGADPSVVALNVAAARSLSKAAWHPSGEITNDANEM